MTHRPPITRDGAQRAAHHELSKAIYHRNAEPIPVRLVKGFGHLIDRLLGKSLGRVPAGNLGAFAVVLIVVVVVVLVIWRVGVPRRAATYGAVLSGSGRALTASEHRALAAKAAAAGDWRTAVVEGMRAIARELEERSVLEPRAGRTATELARDGGRLLPAASGRLNAAANTFNEVVYGGGVARSADAEIMVSADDAIRQSARSKVLAT
jgi:Domain of unknown function (DUF4129)